MRDDRTHSAPVGLLERDGLISPEQLSEYLQVPTGTLPQWRYLGVGPPAVAAAWDGSVRASGGPPLAGGGLRGAALMASKLPPGITPWTPHPQTGRPRYLARWRSPERKPQKQVFDRLIDAKTHLAEVASAKNRGTYVDPALGRQRFDAFAEEWAAAQDTWKEGTSDAWPYIRARLKRLIGDTQIRDIDQLTLKRLRRDLATRYAPNTVKLTMAYAGMILRAAHASGRVARDPTAGLREKRRRADE